MIITLQDLVNALLILFLVTSLQTNASTLVDNTGHFEKYTKIKTNVQISAREKLEQLQTLEKEISTSLNPKLSVLVLSRILIYSSIYRKEDIFKRALEKIHTIALTDEQQQVTNYLVKHAEFVSNYYKNRHFVAISQGEDLRKQLETFPQTSSDNASVDLLSISSEDKAQLLNYLAMNYYVTSNYEIAQKYYLQTLALFEQLKHQRGVAAVLNNLSMISWAQQDYVEALTWLNKSLAITLKLKDIDTYLTNLSNKGTYHIALEQFDEAISTFIQVINHKSIIELPIKKVQALLGLAETYQLTGKYQESSDYIQEAIMLSEKHNDELNLENAKVIYAELLLHHGKYQEAQGILEAAQKQYQKLHQPRKEANVIQSISRLYSLQGDAVKALALYKLYAEKNIALLKKAQKRSINNLNQKFKAESREKQISLLQKENQLHEVEISANKTYTAFVVLVGFSLMLTTLLAFTRYFNNKQSWRLKKHNEEIAKREKQLSLLSYAFKSTSDAVWITNENFEIEVVNNAYVQHTNFEKDAVVGKKVSFAQVEGQDEHLANRIMKQASVKNRWQGELYDRRSTGEVFPLELEVEAIKDSEEKVIHYLGVFRDITEKQKIQQQLTKLATHDDLTGLPNKTLLAQLIQQSCLNAKHSEKTSTVILLNVDGFKKINDSFGHTIGDALIKKISKRLKGILFGKDVVARLSGAEFCILAELTNPRYSAAHVAQKVLSIFDEVFHIDGSAYSISASIGITIYSDKLAQPQELLRNAAIAMFDIKNSEANSYRFFEEDMNCVVTEQLRQEQELLNAINNQLFEFYYQPLVNVATNKISGAEALIRWVEPCGRIIPPDNFIPLAERSGFIAQIDRITIESVFFQVQKWQHESTLFGPVAINLSAKIFSQPTLLISLLKSRLTEYKIPPELIKIEITEGMLLDNIKEAISTMNIIKSLGFKLALDDFGTGFSSLNYLKQFPIDILKIDRSFISGIHENEIDKNIVKSIISLAHTLNLTVVAEGVELSSHYEILKLLKCEEYQGYYFSKPIPSNELELKITQFNSGKGDGI